MNIDILFLSLSRSELVGVLYFLIIFIFVLFYCIRVIIKKIKELSNFVNVYAGGVQRMSHYLNEKNLYEDYQKFSAEKYGEKNND